MEKEARMKESGFDSERNGRQELRIEAIGVSFLPGYGSHGNEKQTL